MKIRVLHAYYGCETGCCGHILEVDGEEDYGTFTFSHFQAVGPRCVLDEIVDAVDGVQNRHLTSEARDYILAKIPKECHDQIDWGSIEIIGGEGC